LAAAAGGEEPDGVVLDHWGDALAKLGRDDEALAAWRRAETAFQKSGEAGKLDAVRKKIAGRNLEK
jgi:predicted negative regulator of RcsB-dependent stress response